MIKRVALGVIVLGLGPVFPMLAANQASLDNSKSFARTALLIVDIQNFYFKDGKIPLVGSVEASLQVQKILERFRAKKLPVIHVRHVPLKADSSDAAYAIHPNVAPLADEKVIVKHYANSFRETELLDYLRQNNIKRMVICGMQTHMCVEAAVRAAADEGFEVILPYDACATRDLSFGGVAIPAAQVHYVVLAALSGTYAKVLTTAELLTELR
jgi:nicotinamidase-related amidase